MDMHTALSVLPCECIAWGPAELHVQIIGNDDADTIVFPIGKHRQIPGEDLSEKRYEVMTKQGVIIVVEEIEARVRRLWYEWKGTIYRIVAHWFDDQLGRPNSWKWSFRQDDGIRLEKSPPPAKPVRKKAGRTKKAVGTKKTAQEELVGDPPMPRETLQALFPQLVIR